MRGPAFFAYADNYPIDLKCGVIMDVEASRAIRQAEDRCSEEDDDASKRKSALISSPTLAADTASWLSADP